jgi:predicted butyrate kinase (DUF1464 family)
VVEWNAPGGNGDVNIPADLARTEISKQRRDDAAAAELRAELMKRLEILMSAGLIDLAALPAQKRHNRLDVGTNSKRVLTLIGTEYSLATPSSELLEAFP